MPNKPVTLYLDHSAPPPVVPVSLGDTDWTFQFTVMNNGAVYAPTVSKVIMTGHKPDGNVVAFTGSKSGNVFNVTPASVQLTAVAGIVACELRLIANNGRSVGTGNFLLQVEEGPEGTVTVASSSSLSAYTTILNQLQQIMSQASTIPSDIAGYISDWLEAHISGGQGVAVDDTLTVQGAAADAKETGDRIAAVYTDIGIDAASSLRPSGSLDGIINNSGTVQSSTATKAFYVPVEPNTTYKIITDVDEISASGNAHFVGQFSRVPSIGDSCTQYSYTTDIPERTVTITTGANTTYLLFGHGGWKTDEHMRVASGESSGKTLGERVADLESKTIETDSTLSIEGAAADAKEVGDRLGEIIGYSPVSTVDLASNFKIIDGKVIAADGTENSNGLSNVVDYFAVTPGTTYKFVFEAVSQLANTRIHAYNESKQWVSQLVLIVSSEKREYTESITVPPGVAYLRISISKVLTIKEFSYTTDDDESDQLAPYDTLSSITTRVENLETSGIRVGDPYVYLSDTIEDEILDSKTCDDLYAIYDGLCTDHPETFVRLPDIGTETSQNLPLRMYRMKWTMPIVTATEASWNQADNIYQSDYDGFRRLFISAGTHGNEKASAYGVALAIKEIVESNAEFAKYIRGNFALDIVPIVNPAGFNATTRNNGSNVNINRDFLTRNTAEAQAIYNVLTSNEYYACIDSHNSGGNANYIGIPNTNPRYKEYIKIGMKFGQIMFNDWKTLATGEQYATSPYTQFWLHTPGAGMMQDLFTGLGLVGWLIESVGVFASSNGTLTPNHKKYCKFTKDLLINSIIVLGSNSWD